jgi:tRNA(Ile)-lysidine synthase
VSGGVDSMALASLCSQMQRLPSLAVRPLLRREFKKNPAGSPLSREIKFQAFVVDHGARKGSDLEAQAVLKILEAREIPTQLLKIDWLGHERPADLPNFESLARKYRFQALGTACRDLGINSLFLGHHEDDQIETLMMRLITGHRMAGLRGIPISSDIPECYGLHGVHESGENDSATRNLSLRCFVGSSSRTSPLAPLEPEFGGVKVYRPLLQFSKARLTATCQKWRMKWFEDHTNNDPTVTMRNSVRHMLGNHALPAALSKPALLELSRKSQATKEATFKVATSWLRNSSVKLETRSGTLKVRFPNLDPYKMDQLKRLGVNGRYGAILLLRRIAMLITPQEHVRLASLVGAVERIFPECLWTQGSPPPPPISSFTVAGLQFKVHGYSESPRDSKPLENFEWLISRQPYMSTAILPKLEIPANTDSSADPTWSAWTLYDGRFWIRVQNTSDASIIVRPFREHDLVGLRASLSKRSRSMLKSLLSTIAPETIRWTLPAIATKGLDGNEKVLALPTLDVGVTEFKKLVKWEVRYKKVEMDILTMSEVQ